MTESTQILEARVAELCRTLRLPSVVRNASSAADRWRRQSGDPLAYLAELLENEVTERNERRALRRLKEAGFPMVKTLEGFDFRRAPDLPESLLRSLSEGSYIERAESVIFIGEPGTGKTHLATALGTAAAQQGRSVRFVTTGKLVNELVEAKDARSLGRIIGRYSRVQVLIVDELGYVPLSKADAELLFQVFSERHEKQPVILTTNLPFSEWTSVFPDPRLCRALIDRLTHRAHIIETGDRSVRLEDALGRRKARRGAKEAIDTQTD